MALRNRLFKVFNLFTNKKVDNQLAHLQPGNTQELVLKLQQRQSLNNLRDVYNFEVESYIATLSPEDQQRSRIIQKYLEEGRNDQYVDAKDVNQQLDKLELLSQLKKFIEMEKDYDPEVVAFEKLRVKVLLGEENSIQNFKDYVVNRPYLKPYLKWADNQERLRNQFFA